MNCNKVCETKNNVSVSRVCVCVLTKTNKRVLGETVCFEMSTLNNRADDVQKLCQKLQ